MKKFLLSLLTVFAATPAFATEETFLTAGAWANNSSYTSSSVTEDTFLESTWKQTNFNNNNGGWDNIRCGRKGNASVASIENTTALNVVVSKIVVATNYEKTGTNDKLNSVKMLVSSDKNFADNYTTKIDYANFATAGDWEFAIPEAAQGLNLYYKLVIDCQSATNNGFLSVSSLKFTYDSKAIYNPGFAESYEIVAGASKVFDFAADAPAMTFTSSDDNVATYDSVAKAVKAVAAGEATFTVTWAETDKWKAGEATFKVSVAAAGVETAEIVVDNEEYTANIGEELKVEYIAETDGEIAVTSSNESVATVKLEEDGSDTYVVVNPLKRGTVTITLNSAKTDNYTSATASFKVTVVDPNAKEATIVFSTLKLDNSAVLTEYEKESVDFEFEKAGASNAPAYYTSGEAARIYNASSFTISVPNGYFLVSATFNCVNNYPVNGIFSNGNCTNNVWTPSEDTNFVKYTHNSSTQLRIVSITVKYTKASDLLGDIFEPAAFNDFMICEDDELALDLGEDHPEVTYTLSNVERIKIENNVVKALKPGPVKVTASWHAVEGKWIAGSEKFTVSVKYATLAEVLADAQKPAEGFVTEEHPEYVGNFPLTIVSVNGNYNYVTDGTAWALFYVNHGHEEGSVIPAGWSGRYTEDHGVPEFNNIKHEDIEETATVELETISEGEITKDRVNQVVILHDVVFSAATPANSTTFAATFAGIEYNFYNQMKLASVAAGTYNVKAAVSLEEGEVVLYPIEYIAQEVTTAPVHADTKLSEGDEVVFTGVEEGAHVYYCLGKEAPDHTNVFTEAGASARRRIVPAAGKTYNHTTHPLTFNGEEMVVSYLAKAPGKAPSKHETVTISSQGVPTSIVEVSSVKDGKEVYDLQGRKVVAPVRGLYIVDGAKKFVR